MNTWLVGFDVDICGSEMSAYIIVQSESQPLAESGVILMGQTWWRDNIPSSDDYCWMYPDKIVWFKSIQMLDDMESSVLRGLKFIDTCEIIGTPEYPVVIDSVGNHWQEFSR